MSARILVLGFMSAESAVIGRRSGCMGMAMSMMTTLFCGEVSRTQMYFSDSMVTWVKVTNCGAMPRLVSCEAIVSGSVKATKRGDLRRREGEDGLFCYREGLAHGDGGVGRRHGDGRRCRDLSLLGLGEQGGGDGWSLHSDLI